MLLGFSSVGQLAVTHNEHTALLGSKVPAENITHSPHWGRGGADHNGGYEVKCSRGFTIHRFVQVRATTGDGGKGKERRLRTGTRVETLQRGHGSMPPLSLRSGATGHAAAGAQKARGSMRTLCSALEEKRCR